MSEPDASVLDWLYRALADSRRRFVLAYLLGTMDGAATFDELVDAVVQSETHPSAPDRDSVAISLHHNHLGLMAEKGLIEYERDWDMIKATDRTQQIKPYFELITDLDPIPKRE